MNVAQHIVLTNLHPVNICISNLAYYSFYSLKLKTAIGFQFLLQPIIFHLYLPYLSRKTEGLGP